MMRENQHGDDVDENKFDKENVHPVSGMFSPRQKKKTSLRSSVLKELTMQSSKTSLGGEAVEVSEREIDLVFEKLGDSLVARKDFREL